MCCCACCLANKMADDIKNEQHEQNKKEQQGSIQKQWLIVTDYVFIIWLYNRRNEIKA